MTTKKRKANDRTGNAFDAALETNDLFVNPPDYERDYRVDEDAGVRFVVPYFFDFICGVKARWAGKRLCELFAEEFPMRPRAYYVKARAMGRLRVEAGGRASDAGATTSGRDGDGDDEDAEHEDGPTLQGGE